MNKITGFSVLTTGEGERVTLSYSVLDADGNIVSTKVQTSHGSAKVTWMVSCP